MQANYSGALTREQFLFHEMRITARLKLEGLSDRDVLTRVYNDNLFQYPTEKEITYNFYVGTASTRVTIPAHAIQTLVHRVADGA